jgi:2-C-methyl-D-erythritol 2,4-cyclodiphosphate synthase
MDISSIKILERTCESIAEAGYRIGNIDCILVAEEPRMDVHIPGMKKALSAAMGCDEGIISIKATTTESMGFTGRREGIAAYAIALINREE